MNQPESHYSPALLEEAHQWFAEMAGHPVDIPATIRMLDELTGFFGTLAELENGREQEEAK